MSSKARYVFAFTFFAAMPFTQVIEAESEVEAIEKFWTGDYEGCCEMVNGDYMFVDPTDADHMLAERGVKIEVFQDDAERCLSDLDGTGLDTR